MARFGRPYILCLVMGAMCGCSARIVPPAIAPQPQPVLVTDYGRHSSLLLPDGPGRMVEFAYGDWNWLALGDTHWYDAFEALFWSPQAALGTRQLTFDATADDLPKRIGCHTVLRIDASEAAIVRLRSELESRFDQHLEWRVYNPVYDYVFVPDDEHYALWNNCNHLTARWLKELGCEIEGSPVTSKFTLASP